MTTQDWHYRVLLTGAKVKVYDAPADRLVVLGCRALKNAELSPVGCAIANQAREDTGNYFEVYRNVVFEQISTTRAYRYINSERNRMVLLANDIGVAERLHGFEVVLRHPSGVRRQSYLNSPEFKKKRVDSKERVQKGERKRPPTRYSKSIGEALQLRESAALTV